MIGKIQNIKEYAEEKDCMNITSLTTALKGQASPMCDSKTIAGGADAIFYQARPAAILLPYTESWKNLTRQVERIPYIP